MNKLLFLLLSMTRRAPLHNSSRNGSKNNLNPKPHLPSVKNNNRAVVDPITWGIIGLIALGGWAYVKVFEPGRNKKVADQIAATTDKANKEAEAAKALAADLQKSIQVMVEAHAQQTKTEQQMRANAAAFNGQNKAVLSADPNPSPYTLIAIGLCDSVDQSLGIQSTPEQRLEWSKRVIPLLQHNAEVEKQLADEQAKASALAASLEAEHAHSVASDAHGATLASQNAANVATIAAVTAQAAKYGAENATWANGAVTLMQRFKAALIGIGVLLVLLFILSWKYRGKDATLHDATAIAEDAKAAATALAKEAGAGISDASKKAVEDLHNWWGGDNGAEAKYKQIVTNLRK